MLRLNFLHKPAETDVKQTLKEIKRKIKKDKQSKEENI
jgi:hypothetical protein